MNTTATQANATPAQLILEGNTYSMSPLTISDLAELERNMQTNTVELATRTIGQLNPKLAQPILSDAVERAARLSINGQAGKEYMTSMAGMTRAIWRSLRHKHKELSYENVVQLLDQPQALAAAMQAFDTVNTNAAADSGNSQADQATPST